jgi:hypothetical protein
MLRRADFNPAVLAVFIGTISMSCASSTPVSDAPLPEAEQENLRCTLLGTWTLQSIDGEPMQEVVNQSWVFNNDGSGVYQQRPGTGIGGAMVTSGDNPFQWRLEGRNIFLDGQKGNQTTVYRADSYSDANMRWFNYKLSDNYVLVRTAAATDGCAAAAAAE